MGKILEVNLDDAAGATGLVQTGTSGGGVAWLPSTAAPTFGVAGHKGNCMDVIGSGRRYVYGPAATYNTIEPAQFTMFCWVYLRSYPTSYYGHIFHKVYRTGTNWTTPWISTRIMVGTGNLGKIYFGVTVLGTIRYNDTPPVLSKSVWHLIGFSYDGAGNLRYYVDDSVATKTLTGLASYAIDYGTHGRWMAGHCNDGSGAVEPTDGLIDRLVVYDEVLSDAAMLAEYNDTMNRRKKLNQLMPPSRSGLINGGFN